MTAWCNQAGQPAWCASMANQAGDLLNSCITHLKVASDSVSEPLVSAQLQLDCWYAVCPGSLSRSSCEAMRPRNVAGGAAWEA